MYITLDKILNEDIAWVDEFEDCYYVKLSKELDDDTVWQLNKNSNRAKYIQIAAYYMMISDKSVREIDPATFKKEVFL